MGQISENPGKELQVVPWKYNSTEMVKKNLNLNTPIITKSTILGDLSKEHGMDAAEVWSSQLMVSGSKWNLKSLSLHPKLSMQQYRVNDMFLLCV